ncbi:DUF192 domain-containing protein [Mesorhizobium sp. CAU 1732]|uniref:DUF192 domain-containing protein n=1 Tax=Mesorhizobium sp. CAU 1732 TaxID=3140358 RepID=UPI00326197AC
MLRMIWILAVVLTVALSPGVSSQAYSQVRIDDGQPMLLPVDAVPLVAETKDGAREFTIEIADDDRERSAGLMFRTEMDDMHGMLFVFEQTRRVSFWMKNTPMPLDLIFIRDDGTVAAVLPGEPFSTASIGPGESVRFVLELKAGTAQKTGIVSDVRLRHPRIDSVADGD